MSFRSFLLLIPVFIMPAQGADLFHVLLDSRNSLHQESMELQAAAFPDLPVGWSLRWRTLHGGRQEGVQVATLHNGTLEVSVAATRGMGILEVRRGDLRIGWDSPVKEVVHPSYINLESRGGLGWLEGFNELMCRCGLEFAGHPGLDTFINNTGDEAQMELTLHGKIANIPASRVEFLVDDQPPHALRIRGRVEERMFYGPKLELWTELSTLPGSDEILIRDILVNHSAQEQEFELIYHTNFGSPLLGAGARLHLAARSIMPFNARAAEGLQQATVYQGPTPGFTEQVYCMELLEDLDGRTSVLLEGAGGSSAVEMAWSVGQLPYFTLWKNLPEQEEGYVTGLEPGTNYPFNRKVERQSGRLQRLKPGEQREFEVSLRVLVDEESIRQIGNRIDALQAGTPALILPQPEL